MRNNVKAYKVVAIERGKRVSAIISIPIRYFVDGRLIKPVNKGGGLFIFDTKQAAIMFANYGSKEIWEVKANNVRFDALDYLGNPMNSYSFPYGTMFCSSLRMIKKVK